MQFDDYDVLVACECSGVIRDALLSVGVRAFSCDLKPTQRPGPHYQGDVRDVLYRPRVGLIAHPVCKYLTNAGAKHLYKRINGKWAKEHGPDEERWRLMREGARFFRLFDSANHIPLRAVENPIMHGHATELIGRRADQYVQPWMFCDPFSKATGFHLTGLPKLIRERDKSWYAERGIKIEQAVWMMAPSADREERRSETYPGIARAVAEQWGPIFLRHINLSAKSDAA